MSVSNGHDVYARLARLLDTMPNGFPATESGVEQKLLRRIFTREEAALFCDLRLTAETAAEVSARTGRGPDGLRARLVAMAERGQILAEPDRGELRFRLVPWVMGIFELQLDRMDRELAELCEAYERIWGISFVSNAPPLFQVVPPRRVEQPLEALPYERVAEILAQGRSFLVRDCVCRVKKRYLGQGCDKPVETCLGIGLTPDAFDHLRGSGRIIDHDEALAILDAAEEAGLVHNTHNFELGHRHICNCCGCCCGLLSAVRDYGIAKQACNSYYWAELDAEACIDCGLCNEERCQTDAIRNFRGHREVYRPRCIGCGLCVTTCPADAITLVRKPPGELVPPPKDERAWLAARAAARGTDLSDVE